ncbi:LPS biosynthesis glycosyltransferase [Aerosakkonemataceae cyanobacterium BLCC-F154]|uniref:LPS biosynthesis glycosyltransferase n=1 Tax=Floridaenema fluviatile BLCC-F154 TaxID=3153640 RepID=A0ABV4YCH5_9CYAN
MVSMNAIAPSPSNLDGSHQLVDSIGKIFIIAHKEPTQLLEESLTKENFQYEVIRQEHKPEYQTYSRSYLCLMNHRHAWEKAIQENKPTLIIEADFVPVIGFGKLPLPFNPHQSNVGISWLYTCAAQVYSVSNEGYAEGFSTSMVAYIITPQSAKYLIELAAEINEEYGTNAYSSWDSDIDKILRKKGLRNYIPFRNYGEHGGLPNLEHYQNGLSKTHRADVLYGKLAFLPFYACEERGGKEKLLIVRIKARFKGIARLLLGKFLRIPIIQDSSTPARLISFAVRRHLSFRL